MKKKKKQFALPAKKLNNFKRPAKIFIWLALFIVLIIIIYFAITGSDKNKENKLVKENFNIYNEPRKVVEKEFLDEPMPENSNILSAGEFKNVEQTVTGKAMFLENSSGKFLRLENFQTFNGQNMHVYLSPVLNLNRSEVVDAGLLRATSGNFNYQLDSHTDIAKYNNILIWSDPYDAFFGYAALIKINNDKIIQESTASSTLQSEPASSTPELY